MLSILKKITFENFEKNFYEALSPTINGNIIFYNFSDYEIILSFSWDNFIIETSLSYENILNMFPNSENDIEVTTSDMKLHPAIIKFISQYTYGRGIEEK